MITYESVTKKYGKIIALDHFSLNIRKGSIAFIIGLNGAGKTTLLRATLGHTLIDDGQISFSTNAPKISAIIETPTFYENMSGYCNLKHHAILCGCSNIEIMDAMSFVGLDSNDKRHVKKYSLGMRQRLKIAEAIMIKPDIMILDEPLNGLDPEGISQVKQLITHLNSQFGITVLVSSHLIKETKDIATEYVIIHHGKLITTFDSAELPNRLKCICLSGNDVGRFVNQINSQFGKTLAVIPCSSELRCYTTDNVTTANLTTYIERLKSSIDDEAVKISESQGTLDEYFLAITRGDSNAI